MHERTGQAIEAMFKERIDDHLRQLAITIVGARTTRMVRSKMAAYLLCQYCGYRDGDFARSRSSFDDCGGARWIRTAGPGCSIGSGRFLPVSVLCQRRSARLKRNGERLASASDQSDVYVAAARQPTSTG